MLLLELGVVDCKLLEGRVDLRRIGFDQCCHLCREIGKMGVDSSGNGLGCVIARDRFLGGLGETGKAIS